MNPVRPFLLFLAVVLLVSAQNKPGPCTRFLYTVPEGSFSSADADSLYWDTVIGARSFAGYAGLEAKWNYLYPWGKDHNGSARMYAGSGDHSQLSLEPGNVLHIKADYTGTPEGKSSAPPHQPIKYHSAALHAKDRVTVSDAWPRYEISGMFKAPIAKGSWPAFWITSATRWPPESDILEFKGNDTNWQNTFFTPDSVITVKTKIPDADTQWHGYKAVLQKVDATDIDISYYIDNQLTSVHRCNFMNEPMWLIINLQMEGSSGSPGPAGTTSYYIKDVLLRRAHRR
jgi:hypothetical protein